MASGSAEHVRGQKLSSAPPPRSRGSMRERSRHAFRQLDMVVKKEQDSEKRENRAKTSDGQIHTQFLHNLVFDSVFKNTGKLGSNRPQNAFFGRCRGGTPSDTTFFRKSVASHVFPLRYFDDFVENPVFYVA